MYTYINQIILTTPTLRYVYGRWCLYTMYIHVCAMFCVQVDLVEIKKEFLKMYHKTLYKMIEGDTSGDYRRFLFTVCMKHDCCIHTRIYILWCKVRIRTICRIFLRKPRILALHHTSANYANYFAQTSPT